MQVCVHEKQWNGLDALFCIQDTQGYINSTFLNRKSMASTVIWVLYRAILCSRMCWVL